MKPLSARLLMIARAYPPIIGGLEHHNYAISRELSKRLDCQLLVNRHGIAVLPVFLPWAACRAHHLAPTVKTLLLGDLLLAPLGALLKKMHPHMQVIAVAHGLDLTYPHFFYQRCWLKNTPTRLDHIIAVSQSTAKLLTRFGVSEQKISIIGNGIDTPEIAASAPSTKTRTVLTSLGNRCILLSLGRLITRKGFLWFAREVLPRLPDIFAYVIAGNGPEFKSLLALANSPELRERLHVLGEVSEADKALLFSQAHIFIQPNIPVPGDHEGFGLAVLEAARTGLPCVASALEGLNDVVINNYTGILVPPSSTDAFVNTLNSLHESPSHLSQLAKNSRTFAATRGWDVVSEQYIKVIQNTSIQ